MDAQEMNDDSNEALLKKLHALFAVVMNFVDESGGDGDGWIISENYKALADEFGKWRYGKGFRGMDVYCQRDDMEDAVSFSDNQESVCFIKSRSQLPPWAGDIVVESSHFEWVGKNLNAFG